MDYERDEEVDSSLYTSTRMEEKANSDIDIDIDRDTSIEGDEVYYRRPSLWQLEGKRDTLHSSLHPLQSSSSTAAVSSGEASKGSQLVDQEFIEISIFNDMEDE
jgi:hypothetical protein